MKAYNINVFDKDTVKVPVTIECPECHTVQPAEVEFVKDFPFGVYFHECVKCKHIILESEWNEVKDGGLEKVK